MRSSCGIFFISAAALLLEIALTRIFSVSRWYHFAFMVVSIALLGFAASGSFLNLFPQIRANRASPFYSSLLFSVSVVLSFYVSDKIEMDPYKIMLNPYLLGSIAVYYFLLSLPFLFAGFSISILLSENPDRSGSLYGCSLAGSGAGCVLIFLFSVAGPKILLVSSALGVISAFCFSYRSSQRTASLIVLVILLVLPHPVYDITMSSYKSLSLALNYPEAQILYTDWNAVSRVDVVKSPLRHAPGLSLAYTHPLPTQLGVTVDGDNISPLSDPAPFVEFLPAAAVYSQHPERVLIINPQGTDIATALYFGASTTVAEGNPLVVESIKRVSSLYDDITVVYQDGRTFLASSDQKYDVIQISLSESLFASSVGLYGLNESYALTKEAFHQYYSHLTDHGVLVITRWLQLPPRQLPKLVSLITDTLDTPQDHMVIFRSYSTVTVMVKKTPFTDVSHIERFCKEKKFDLVWTPFIRESQVNVYNQFDNPFYYETVKSQIADNDQVTRDYLFNIASPTDDSPFFFNFFQWRKFSKVYHSLQGKWQPFFEGGFMALLILVQALLVSLVLIVAPLKKLAVASSASLYFALIGLAFMCVEIALIQQLILFLGQPTYSMALVLFCILLFSGLGSSASKKVQWRRGGILLCLSLLLVVGGLSWVIHSGLGLHLGYKVALIVGVLAPLSFFMGMPFPTGLALLHRSQVPHAWCVNGCFSVIGSVIAVMVALSFGFRIVLLFGLLCYGAAYVVRMWWTRDGK